MSKKNKKQKLFKRSKVRYYRKTIIWVSFLIVVLYATSFWSNHQSMTISNIEIVGNKYVDSDQIEKLFFEEISGRYFFLISKSNFLFIPKQVISEKINQMLPVDSVVVRRSDIDTVVIEIVEYQPIAKYCLEKKCYFVNNSGLLFVEATDLYPGKVVDLEGQIISEDVEDAQDSEKTEIDIELLGENYANPQTFQNLFEKIELLIAEDIEISKISTNNFETYTLHTIGGPTLLVEETDIPSEIISNLKAALVQESIHEVQFNNIDYIDLRFEDKVFYKLK